MLRGVMVGGRLACLILKGPGAGGHSSTLLGNPSLSFGRAVQTGH